MKKTGHPPKHRIFELFSDENASGVAYKNKFLKRSILSHLDQHGDFTITELSRELNTSVPKITSLVNELIEDKLIRDNGKFDSTGGRKASIYGLVADACFFIGVDVKRYYINLGLLNFRKHLVNLKEKIPYRLENTQESFHQLLELIRQYLQELNIPKNKILGMGINLSGRINQTSGYSYSYFHFQEEPLAETIQRAFGIPTFLENDSRAMAYGEFCNGEVAGARHVLFVNVDYGIGLGILVNGKLYYGKSGFSGEFGHIPFFENEILCHCGKKGCLETEASGQSLLRKFREKIKQGSTSSAMKKKKDPSEITLLDIMAAAHQEDMLCIEMLADLGEKIGKGLAMLINVFNPELLILGGTLSETGDYLRLPVKSAINKYSLSLVNSDTQLRISRLGEKAGVVGACLIARDKVLSL
ncbi:MAG: ROK family transcriptional regulator [Sphingomonadales bacterium]|jgi:glucokinase-like ROK family protein|nr:ROK family transcriptional regulator [Sphingomonadales bacterium]